VTARAALVLGICLILAALVHGGLFAPGHDFVVNRFTGHFQFVPSEDDAWGDEDEGVNDARCRALTSKNRPDRLSGLYRRR
jgi:hypothetical protein